MTTKTYLTFAWWNVWRFAAFDPSRMAEDGWPVSPVESAARCDALADAFAEIEHEHGALDVVALGECTRPGAEALRDRAFPGFEVITNRAVSDPRFDLAFIVNPAVAADEQVPINAQFLPRRTRASLVVDVPVTGGAVRFIACHWPARFDKEQARSREQLAEFLGHHAFDYLARSTPESTRHLVILGDLNEEPFELPETRMHARRDRLQSHKRTVWQDKDVKRVNLYNAAFRFVGERRPHGQSLPDDARDAAGTYYWSDERSWHVFDHVIVSGSLVSDTRPSLDEATLRIHATRTTTASDGLPRPFNWRDGRNAGGVSDHLPIVGRLVLP